MKHLPHRLLTASALLSSVLATACGESRAPAPEPTLGAQVSGLCAAGTTVNAAFDVTDANGQAVDLTTANTTITVETRAGGGAWQPVDGVFVGYDGPSQMDVVLVADNSGSEQGHLDEMRSALAAFSEAVILGRDAPDRVGLVRVSTESKTVQDLTEDTSLVQSSIDGLFVTNGWTALWDGLRTGNELLDGGAQASCELGAYRAIAAFTDGKENHSVATTEDDVRSFTAGGAPTPLQLIGVGDAIDEGTLASLADDTGGHYTHIDGYADLLGALLDVETGMSSAVPISFQVTDCEQTEARLTAKVTLDGATFTLVVVEALPQVCPG